jgi:hypothetical protein
LILRRDSLNLFGMLAIASLLTVSQTAFTGNQNLSDYYGKDSNVGAYALRAQRITVAISAMNFCRIERGGPAPKGAGQSGLLSLRL